MFFKKMVAASAAWMLIVANFSSDAQQTTSKDPPAVKTTSGTSPQTPSAPPKPNTLLDGTPVKLRLGRTLSSADTKVGDEVDFEVLEDVTVDSMVVIPKGALALATVTTAEHKKNMGRGGKLDVNIDSVRLIDNEKAALRATEGGKAGGHVGAMTGAMVATSIVFFPAAPLFLFMHGKDMTIPKGTEVTAYVNGDMTLDMAKLAPTTVVASASIPAGTSEVTVEANVPNCDINVDGAFVGSTPSKLTLSSGKHEITVAKKGYAAWTRTLTVSASVIHISAEMEVNPTVAAPTSN
jgi:hypothetical protein